MPSQASRTFPWLSALLLALGSMVGSPEAGLALLVLSAASAPVPVVAGPGRTRIIGAIPLLAALGSAVLDSPAAKRRMQEYRGRAPGGETKTR